MAEAFAVVVALLIALPGGWYALRLMRSDARMRRSLPANSNQNAPTLFPISPFETLLHWKPQLGTSRALGTSLYYLLQTVDGRSVASLQWADTATLKDKNAIAQASEGKWYFEKLYFSRSINVYESGQLRGVLKRHALGDDVFDLRDGGQVRFQSRVRLLDTLRTIVSPEGVTLAELEGESAEARVRISVRSFQGLSLVLLLQWYAVQVGRMGRVGGVA